MTTRTILTARDGYIYTNGNSYGYIVFLGTDDEAAAWREITIEQYNEIMKAEEDNATNGILFE